MCAGWVAGAVFGDGGADVMSVRPFRHLCPEADLRDAMTDGEFWEHVSRNLTGGSDYYGPDDDPPDMDVQVSETPCGVCGEHGACGYDAEGRPLIHTTDDNEAAS